MKNLHKLCVASLMTVFLLTGFVSAGEITAFIEPYRDIDVASPEMGTLAHVKVKEGDRVIAGQVLATLDENVLEAALNMAKKAVESRGKLQSAEAELRLQESRLEKLLGLHERRHASEEEVARAQAQREIAQAQVQAVRDEIDVKTADYLRIKAQLDQKRIKSPINGTVTYVYKDAGEFVSASEPMVLKVVQLDSLLAVFSVPSSDARNLSADQEVSLTVGAGRDSVRGVIEFVSPTADAQSGTSRVKVRIPNSKGRLQSGDGCWLEIGSSESLANGANTTTRNTSVQNKRRP